MAKCCLLKWLLQVFSGFVSMGSRTHSRRPNGRDTPHHIRCLSCRSGFFDDLLPTAVPGLDSNAGGTRKPHWPYSLSMRLVVGQFRETPALVCLPGNTTVLFRPEPRHGQRECTFSLLCSTKFRLNDQALLTTPDNETITVIRPDRNTRQHYRTGPGIFAPGGELRRIGNLVDALKSSNGRLAWPKKQAHVSCT